MKRLDHETHYTAYLILPISETVHSLSLILGSVQCIRVLLLCRFMYLSPIILARRRHIVHAS